MSYSDYFFEQKTKEQHSSHEAISQNKGQDLGREANSNVLVGYHILDVHEENPLSTHSAALVSAEEGLIRKRIKRRKEINRENMTMYANER